MGSATVLLVILFAFASVAQTANGNFTGKVVDSRGQPVSGATVEVYEPRTPTAMVLSGPDLALKQRATTDGGGSFSVAFPQTGTVFVTKRGYAAAWKTRFAGQGELDNSAFVLAPPSSLAGIVVDDHGQPVANADVWVDMAVARAQGVEAGNVGIQIAAYAFGAPVRDSFHARTSSDGRFRIADFPPDTSADLSARAPGKAMRRAAGNQQRGLDQPTYRAGQEDIKLVLDPGGTIEGKVTVQATGEPVAHVAVEARLAQPGLGAASEPVQSGADGTFRIPDLAAGNYTIAATFPGKPVPDWTASVVFVTVAAGETARNVKVEAVKGGVLEVTVRSKPDGKVGASATVNIYGQGQPFFGTADADGVAMFRLAPGQVAVVATATGGGQIQQQATVVANETTRVRLDVPAPHRVAGMVRDAAGKAVAGASLMVFPDAGRLNSPASSDSSGHYEITWQEPPWGLNQEPTYTLVARDMTQNLATSHEIDAGTTALDLTLEPGLTISTRVQDNKGSPIANASVSVMFNSGNSSWTLPGRPGMSDSDGRVSVPAIPAGQRYGLWASASGYGNVNVMNLNASRGQTRLEVPPITLRLANRKLAGRVLGENGKPVANAQVFFNGDGQPNGNTQTDDKGRFSFDAVCEGPLSVQANAQGSFGSQPAMGGDTNVVIRMGQAIQMGMASATVSGRVYDRAGNAAVGVPVIVTPSFGAFNQVTTDDNGEYTINWQPQQGMRNAKYLVIARDPGRELAAAEPVDEKTTKVDLHLDRGFTISGVVQDTAGAPLPQADVNLNIMTGNMGGLVGSPQPAKCDSNGSFTIHALPRGKQYVVSISANGYGSRNRQVRQSQTQTNHLELPVFRLPVADRMLAGRVLGEDKKPVPGAQVNINGDGQPNGFMNADAEGHFSFKVCAGEVIVFASAPPRGGGQYRWVNVQANGGDTNVVVQFGTNQGGRQAGAIARATPLIPQPWTWMAVLNWPDRHRTATIFLMGAQVLALAGTATGIFAVVRRQNQS